jgi:hypothetical protein
MEMPIVWFVSQISMPVRILLIGAVVFLAAWFTLLRPKSETVPPQATSTTTTPAATSTPQTGLGKAVDAAKKAAGVKTEATATATPATGTATTTTPETKPENAPIQAVPADVLAKLPKNVAGALKDRKVLVLGVLSEDATRWRPLADDDRYVRNALKRTNRYEGEVVVKQVGLDKLSTYGPLVNDLGVTQSPSIVVIDRNLKGTVLTGYVDRVAINQAIADARRVSITPNLTDTYLRKANSLCGRLETRLSRWSLPTVRGRKPFVASQKRELAIVAAYRHAVQRLAAPAKWRGLKAAWVAGLKRDEGVLAARVVYAKTGKAADLRKAEALYRKNDWSKVDRRFYRAGLTDCAENRTS